MQFALSDLQNNKHIVFRKLIVVSTSIDIELKRAT